MEEIPLAGTQVSPDKIVTLLLLAPDGICQMNEVLTGLVDTSDNLGELHMDSREFRMVFEIRSAQDSLQTIYMRKYNVSLPWWERNAARKLSTQAGISGHLRRYVKLRRRFTERNTVRNRQF